MAILVTSSPSGGYASSHDCRVNCGLRSADRRGRRPCSRGVQRLGRATDRRARCPPGSWRAATRSPRRLAGTPPAASQMRAAPDPRILTGWSGASPHVLRFPPRAFLRFPVCPPGSPPFARLPLVSLRPAFSGSSPSAVARFQFPFGVPPGSLSLSNLHDSAAAGRFRRRWSQAARAKVTSPAATPRLDLAMIRPALQMGSGRARRDAATESPVTSGREHRTPPRPNRPDLQ